MLGGLATPFAEFFEFYFFLYEFLVLAGPVIDTLASSATQFD